jgi:hypothetical protein
MIHFCELEAVGTTPGHPSDDYLSLGLRGNASPPRPTGRRPDPGEAPMREPTEQGAVYARVSSPDQRADLDRQVAQVVAWANAQSLAIGQG